MLDSDLSLDFLRVVEEAAVACAQTMGQGDRHKSDAVAVEAMRRVMTAPEAARVLGVPPGTVYSRLHYATRQMRGVLASDAPSALTAAER